MATLTAVRDALATLLKTELQMQYAAGRMPSPLFPSTVFTRPTPGSLYVSFEEPATFDRPLVSLSAFIVGPSSNLEVCEKWLDAAILLAMHAGDTDPTLGGKCSGIMVRGVSETGLLNVEGTAPVLSAEIRFHPFYLSP